MLVAQQVSQVCIVLMLRFLQRINAGVVVILFIKAIWALLEVGDLGVASCSRMVH